MRIATDSNRTSVSAGLGGGFAALLTVRALTVLNDNLLRWLAIGIGKRAVDAGGTALVLTIGTAGFVLPFVTLAWLAGWLADRFPKRSVIAWAKAAEIVIATAAAAVVAWGAGRGGMAFGLPTGLWLLLATVVVIGIQAALLAPSILGAISETVAADRLAQANGIFAMVTLAATLAGMAGGNWLADLTPLAASAATAARGGLPAGAVLVGIAIAGWLAALALDRMPAADPRAPAPINAVAAAWRDLREVFGTPKLLAAAAGSVFFWALGAVAQLNVDQYAAESGATSQAQVIPLLVTLVGGIGLGSALAGTISARGVDAGSRIDLGIVPVGALLMTVACIALALSPTDVFAASAGQWLRLTAPLCWLGILGVGAGLFDVPLEAFLQEQSPPARRGAVLASTNLLVFTGMFAASLAYGALRTPIGSASTPLVSARGMFAAFGIGSLAAFAAAVWCAPRSSLRMLVAAIVRGIWRFRIRGADRLPAEGPVVMVANHLSWLDGFLLPLASPRPVRMVVYGPNIRGRFLRMLADQWRFILFDPRPKSIGAALKTIQSGLRAGDVVGIFCEGGISRTGQLLGFKRGLEWLLDRVESPIVPVSIDGMWGSGLSFSGGKYFRTWPRLWRRPVTVTFGPTLPAGTRPEEARLALQETAARAVARRLVPRAATAEAFDGCCLIRRRDRLVCSLAPGDPLHESLGRPAARLLGIRATSIAATTPPVALLDALGSERATVWIARVEQVQAAAAARSPAGLADHLTAIVMPIGRVADLPRARAAAERFHAAHGIEAVVAYAPPEVGLVAMNTPRARTTWDHEVVAKPDTVGRVVNGVAVWPQAAIRARLGMPIATGAGVADDSTATLVIAATGAGTATTGEPHVMALSDSFTVDPDGFLVAVAASPADGESASGPPAS